MKIKWCALACAMFVSCIPLTACNGNDDDSSIVDVNKTGTFYETEMRFYVNPIKAENLEDESIYNVYSSYSENVMRNMVQLLSSERFAEILMLDEDGLPSDDMLDKIRTDKGNDVANALEIKVDTARQSLRDMESKQEYLEEIYQELATKKSERNALQAQVNREWNALGYTGTPSRVDSAMYDEEIAYNILWDEYQVAIETYNAVLEEESVARGNVTQAKGTKRDAFEEAIGQWRTDYSAYYANELTAYYEAVSYSYKNITDDSEMVRSFFYVAISVKDDETFANEVRDKIIQYVPKFVKEHMPLTSEYVATECVRITLLDQIQAVVYKNGKKIS